MLEQFKALLEWANRKPGRYLSVALFSGEEKFITISIKDENGTWHHFHNVDAVLPGE